MRLSVLPLDVANECQQYDRSNDEYCSGYRITGITLARFFSFLDSHGNAVSALAALTIASFTATLWWSTRGLWLASNRSAEAAENAVAEARGAKDAAWAAVAENSRIGNAQVRAYVCPNACFLNNIAVGEKIQVKIRFVNFGTSPAHAVNVRGSIIFGDLPQKLDHSQPLTSLPTNTAGLPQGIPGSTEFSRKRPFSAEESRQFIDGKGAFYIYVVISYLDVFGLKNVSRTTFVYGHKDGSHRGKASVAPYGNSFEWGKNP